MRKLHLSAFAILALATSVFAAGEKEYVAGLAAMDKADYAKAVQLLDKALAADEGNGQYLEARGVAKALAQDLPGATSDLQLAIKNSDPRDWEPKGWLGVVNRMAGRFAEGFNPGLAGRDNRDYALAMNDMGQNYGMSVTRGTYYDKQTRRTVQTNSPYTGDFAAAAHMFVQRHRGTSNDTGGAIATATLDHVKELMAAKDYSGALQELTPLIAANPDDPAVLTAQGECLSAVGNVLDARRAFTRALTHQSDSAEPYVGRALAAMAVGDAAQALHDFSMAQILDPQHAAWMQQQMTAAAKSAITDDPQTLLKQFQSRLATNPGITEQQVSQLALQLVKSVEAHRVRYDEQYQQHRTELESALKRDPQSANRMVDLARFLYEESSIQSETVGPRGETIYYRNQTDATQKADITQAASLADAALAIDPRNVPAMALKSEILLDAKNFDDAEDWARKALAISPNDPNLLELLAKLLQVDAAYKITAAGNLKQPKDFFETRFDEYPPVEYHWIIYPSDAELRQAAEYEREAQQFADLAQQTITAAIQSGGRTKLGLFFQAATQHMTGHLDDAADSLNQALALDAHYQKALYELAAVYTEQKKGDDAIRTRTLAMNLSQTTDAPWMVAAWYKIPHGALKTGRAALAEAATLDPSDARIWAYTAVLDEAEGNRDSALTNWQLAQSIAAANLQLHGQTFGDPHPAIAPTPTQIGLAAMIQLRIALTELENGHPVQAQRDFTLAANTLNTIDPANLNTPIPTAMLPDPHLAAGVVPAAETVTSLRIRASAGIAYAQWAAITQSPNDTALAAQTFRRFLIDRPLTLESMESYQAMADLGMAELALTRGDTPTAQKYLQNAPSVPQDLWQEMRKAQSQSRGF